MRVYIAGQYARRDEFRLVAEELRKRGIYVTSGWLEEDEPLNHNLADFPTEWKRKQAYNDMGDIDSAEFVLFFAEPSDEQPKRGGRHVEFGYALGKRKPINVIGGEENIFHYSYLVKHYPSLERFLESFDV
jgi:nucleoside 2-deoxyribosyltransferase